MKPDSLNALIDEAQEKMREQIRRAHAELEAEYAQPGEFSVDFYAAANGWPGGNGHSRAARELTLLEERGTVTKRTGIMDGRRCKLYKWV